MKKRSPLAGVTRIDRAVPCEGGNGCEFLVPRDMARIAARHFGGRVLCVPHGRLEDPTYYETADERIAREFAERMARRAAAGKLESREDLRLTGTRQEKEGPAPLSAVP